MTNEEIVEAVNKISEPFGLKAEILPNSMSVGVGGDNRSYTPVVNLSGPFPGWDILEKVSLEITNTLPVNRVTFEIETKKEN